MAVAKRLGAALAIVAGMLTGPALAQTAKPSNSVAAGAFHIERPTLISLGFDWRITGDDNRNAKVGPHVPMDWSSCRVWALSMLLGSMLEGWLI